MKTFLLIGFLIIATWSCTSQKYALKVTNEETGKTAKFKKGGTITLQLKKDVQENYINQFNTGTMQSYHIEQIVQSDNPGILIRKQNGLNQLVLIEDIDQIRALTKTESAFYAVGGIVCTLTGIGMISGSEEGITAEKIIGISFIAATTPLLILSKKKIFRLRSDSYAEIILRN